MKNMEKAHTHIQMEIHILVVFNMMLKMITIVLLNLRGLGPLMRVGLGMASIMAGAN